MKIQISSKIKRVYSIRGKQIVDPFYQPVLEDGKTRCIFKIKISDGNRQGAIVVQPQLIYGPGREIINQGTKTSLPLDLEDHEVTWDFVPYEHGHNQIGLNIEQLGEEDRVYDDYDNPLPTGNYMKTFHAYSLSEYVLFWFAGISTIGAIAEILNMILSFT